MRRETRPAIQQKVDYRGSNVPVLSVVMSIYNRSELFRYGLLYLSRQTLPAKAWQLVLVDDGSTEDLSRVYKPYQCRINVVHIRMNHKAHPIWKEMNPKWSQGKIENWTATPALSVNLGGKYAVKSGTPFISICQPEMLLSPNALERGLTLADKHKAFVFPDIALSPPSFRETIDQSLDWEYEKLWQKCRNHIQQANNPERWKVYPKNENYWFNAYIRTQWFLQINGVDEEYLRGEYAEDDNFKRRLQMAGVPHLRDSNMYAIHLDHSHESLKKSRRATQWQDPKVWKKWSDTNRARWRQFTNNPAIHGGYLANQGKDWGSEKCVRWIREFPLTQ